MNSGQAALQLLVDGFTHVSWAQAYKAHVGGVSPRCGIEQNREVWPKRTIPANWGLRQETLPQFPLLHFPLFPELKEISLIL